MSVQGKWFGYYEGQWFGPLDEPPAGTDVRASWFQFNPTSASVCMAWGQFNTSAIDVRMSWAAAWSTVGIPVKPGGRRRPRVMRLPVGVVPPSPKRWAVNDDEALLLCGVI